MAAAARLLLHRARLAEAAEVPAVEDQLRLAELLDAVEPGRHVRLLREAAEIRRGFPGRTGAGAGAAAGGTVGIAITELERLARDVSDRLAAALAASDAFAEPAPTDAVDLAEAVSALHAFLSGGTPADRADAALAGLRLLCRSAGRLDHRAFAAAPAPVLAEVTALAGLQDFVGRNHDLLSYPFGSAALLGATARFDAAGLGPYLSNVGRIAGRSRDVFELAGIAHRAGGGRVPVEHWVVLLSQHLRREMRDEVVDDLGDLGASHALNLIHARAARRADDRVDVDLVLRIRDVALDNGDLDLASRAQASVVRLRPDNRVERVILGSIDATAGRIAAAEQSFLHCLRLDAGDPAAAERLAALRAGRFEPFAVRWGYASPTGRMLTRLRRRAGPGVDTRVAKHRPPPVEL